MKAKVSKVKEILSHLLVKDFIEEGFRFKRSDFLFKKNVGKNLVECYFDFYKFPIGRVEYNFNFQFTIFEIEALRREVLKRIGSEYRPSSNVILVEGDFEPGICLKEWKFRNAFTRKIWETEADMAIFQETKATLVKNFFPILPSLSTLENLQNFILQDFERSAHLNLNFSGLLALKLKDKQSFIDFLDFVKLRIGYEEMGEDHFFKQFIDGVVDL